jgi:hypothetical protein
VLLSFLVYSFVPEDGSDMLHQNVGDYHMVLYRRKQSLHFILWLAMRYKMSHIKFGLQITGDVFTCRVQICFPV